MTAGSLFSGVGALDAGLEDAGMTIVWQVEKNRRCREILERHWPRLPRGENVRDFEGTPVDLVAGGDPCPSRSRARGNRPSKHPDLAGYFLAVAGRLRPQWVLRENVPAPNALDFALGLECLGYRVSSVALDARDFTGQSRRRQFLCGCLDHGAAARFERAVSDAADGFGFSASSDWEETPVAACLTAHGMRLAAEDTYCFEPGIGLRVLAAEEAEALQGLPRGWTAGFPERTRRGMTGNAVCRPAVTWLGRRILESVEAPQ